MFKSVKSLLPSVLAHNKIAPQIGAIVIGEKTNEIIRGILGPRAHAHTHAAYYKDSVVTIKSNSATHIAELKLYESAILEALADTFPNKKIEHLRFIRDSEE